VGTLIGLLVLFLGGAVIGRSVSQARSSAWAGPQTRGMRQRAAGRPGGPAGQRPVRHEMKLRRLDAQLRNWLAGEEHARKNGSGSAPAPPSRPPAAPGRARATAAAVKRLGQLRVTPGNGASAQPGPQASQPAASPARPAPAAASNGSPGRTATVASNGTGGTEQLVEGINQVHAAAVSGGIHAKQQGMKASTEGSIRFGQMASMLSRTMSEPGSNYGPEITEPLGKASQHLQAAAMAFGEADAALTTLMSMSVGELAASSRQAPNHAELSENGSR